MTADVDPARWPTLAAYLADLPMGIGSYPECVTKGGLFRSAFDGHDLSENADELPAALCALMESQPAITAWVPAVLTDAAFHVVCDKYYPSESAVVAWTRARSLKMGSSPTYRSFFRVAGPALFIRGTGRVHNFFAKGTTMNATTDGKTARVVLRHPPHLHSALNQKSNVGMILGVLEITGGINPRCKMTESSPTGAVYECSWS